MLALVIGFLLALGQCLAVGPVNTEALRRGLRDGFRAALAVELGSSIGDGLWAALALAGLGALLTLQFMDLAATLIGIALLGWLALTGWREAAAVMTAPGGPIHESSTGGRLPAFWAGALLGIANPGSAAFWIGVGATLLATRLPVHGPAALAEFALGYYAAVLLWCVSFAAFVWQAGLRLPARAQTWIQRVASLLLGAFALFSAISFLRRHLHGIV
jgi:chemosensory pili system protein ChpE